MITPFIKYKQDKGNIIANALSRMHVLFNTLNIRLLGFEHVKELYMDNDDFGRVYGQCEHSAFDTYFRYGNFCLKIKDRVCLNVHYVDCL
jgi:hypothetical protein